MVTIQGAAAMGMTPGLRKFTLTAHVSASVGWLGAVAAFLALAIAGLTHEEPETIRGAYVAMDLVGWFVIVPSASRRCSPALSSRSARSGGCSGTIGSRSSCS
jgi:hypothetical protein